MFQVKNIRTRRRGFGFVETVICIVIAIILGASVFAGGSYVVKKSQNNRTSSDLYNFSIALETFLNETSKVANCASTADFAGYLKDINEILPTEYQIGTTAITTVAESGGNITINSVVSATTPHVAVYESAKTDAWGNHYYVILDFSERHGANNSDFYITVVSAGADARTDLAGKIGGDSAQSDDIFLLVQYTNGEVSSFTYTTPDSTLHYFNTTSGALDTLATNEGWYATAADGTATNKCPVNN